HLFGLVQNYLGTVCEDRYGPLSARGEDQIEDISIKRRKGEKKTISMSNDIYDMYVYLRGLTDFFPRSVLSPTSRMPEGLGRSTDTQRASVSESGGSATSGSGNEALAQVCILNAANVELTKEIQQHNKQFADIKCQLDQQAKQIGELITEIDRLRLLSVPSSVAKELQQIGNPTKGTNFSTDNLQVCQLPSDQTTNADVCSEIKTNQVAPLSSKLADVCLNTKTNQAGQLPSKSADVCPNT
ncbi:unnamed protein product, partial [Owenia fusiformis]